MRGDRNGPDIPPDAMMERVFGDDPLSVLRRKWSVVPSGTGRVSTNELMALPDGELLDTWDRLRAEATTGAAHRVRGWYHLLYKDVLRDRTVVDFGCGLGIDGVSFAENGARVIFVDIVEDNLALVRRLCRARKVVNVDFLYLEDIASIGSLPRPVDVFWCQGSMINVPFDFARREARAMLEHLPTGGRWIELAYPEARWEREGRLPFHLWGERTDGPGTPWVEWYDVDRLRRRLRPAKFDVVLDLEFSDGDFVWFDLMRVG